MTETPQFQPEARDGWNTAGELGPAFETGVVVFGPGGASPARQWVATEVPLTILAGEREIATLQCSPTHLRELVYGFLYAAGFIASAAEVRQCEIDTARWTARVDLEALPDPELLRRRIFTPGCGKGVVYADLAEASARLPLRSSLRVDAGQIRGLATWLQHASADYRATRGLHTAALSEGGRLPDLAIDDIGRHNAVDKAIGGALLRGADLGGTLLVSSGRVSTEILTKARRCGIPIIVARGAPTHQTVLRARDVGLTIVGFARGNGFTVFAHPERIAS